MSHGHLSLAPLLLLALAQDEPSIASSLTFGTLDAWSAHLLPRAEEVAWEAIPWISTFSEGIEQAADEGRPLLFWAMNGHPLGCT